jgi:hypothetical protein
MLNQKDLHTFEYIFTIKLEKMETLKIRMKTNL